MSKSFYNKSSYVAEDLIFLIDNEIEESINLDYKSSKSLDKSDRKKSDIAKDVSAFANSDGGIIIYGLNEENHKPTEISFIDGNIYNKEWLENIIDGNIQQRILDIEIFPLRIGNKIKQTVYIVKIPSSLNAPHLSSDKKYYRRFNFKSVPMEEYEIRLLYNRKNKAEIKYKTSWSKKKPNAIINDFQSVIREISIHVENISETIEENCKIEVYFTFEGSKHIINSLSYNLNDTISHKVFEVNGNKVPMLNSYNSSPIFPKEEYKIISFTVQIKEEEYEEFWNNGIMNVVIYDSNKTSKVENKVSSLFQKNE